MRLRQNQRGFAFVELLLVLTAVALLVLFGSTRMGRKNEEAARQATQ